MKKVKLTSAAINVLVNEYMADPNCRPKLWIETCTLDNGEKISAEDQLEFIKRVSNFQKTDNEEVAQGAEASAFPINYNAFGTR